MADRAPSSGNKPPLLLGVYTTALLRRGDRDGGTFYALTYQSFPGAQISCSWRRGRTALPWRDTVVLFRRASPATASGSLSISALIAFTAGHSVAIQPSSWPLAAGLRCSSIGEKSSYLAPIHRSGSSHDGSRLTSDQGMR